MEVAIAVASSAWWPKHSIQQTLVVGSGTGSGPGRVRTFSDRRSLTPTTTKTRAFSGLIDSDGTHPSPTGNRLTANALTDAGYETATRE